MKQRFLKLNLDDVAAGMRLFETLHDGHGGVLLPAGTELTDSNLNSLRRRGIDEIAVVDDTLSDVDLAAERMRIEERLAQLFRKCGTQGANGLLLQGVSSYRTGDSA